MQRACTLCVSTLCASKNVFIPKCSSYLSTSSIIFNNGGFNLFLGCVHCKTLSLMIPCFSRLNLILNPQILFKFSDKKKLWVGVSGYIFHENAQHPWKSKLFHSPKYYNKCDLFKKIEFRTKFCSWAKSMDKLF